MNNRDISLSDLLPHLAQRVDAITFTHSIVPQSSNHTPRRLFQMNTRFQLERLPLHRRMDQLWNIRTTRVCRVHRAAPIRVNFRLEVRSTGLPASSLRFIKA
jgi:hypothetical protein